jgi:hypothetical protein
MLTVGASRQPCTAIDRNRFNRQLGVNLETMYPARRHKAFAAAAMVTQSRLAVSLRHWRRRAGVALAALYVLALAAPVTTIALSVDAPLVHCLTEALGIGTHHDHAATAQAGQHHSGLPDHDHGQGEKCCGLFGVTAIAPGYDVADVPLAVASAIAFPRPESLYGRGSDRIDRPPRTVLSL